MDMEAPAPPTAEVIDIQVLREGRLLRGMRDKCQHHRVALDPVLTTIQCRDCNAMLNPVAWLADHREYWEWVRRMAADYHEARARLEERKVTRCEHCLKMTRIQRISKRALQAIKRGSEGHSKDGS